MKNQDYTKTLLTDQTPKQTFYAILNVRGWWSGLYNETIEGSTNKLNDEFTFRAGDGAHYSKQKLIEVVPDKKIVWLVLESNLTFLAEPNEWNGTQISFEISTKGKQTQIQFTHRGLNSTIECFDSCSDAWSRYLQQCLLPLIAKGEAQTA